MKTVVAETVLLGREAFETLGELVVIPDREIGPHHVADADALIIRSKTRVTPDLLAGSSVRFVGTATAGFEHLDVPWLEANGIGWTSAPGCNADSVADYILSALLHLDIDLEGRTLGVIGVGQVGSRVARRASALGLRIFLNDPPREAREGSAEFHRLKTVLAHSDIVTLHVPLIDQKPWPTRHLANCRFFEQMKSGSVLMNASRGKVLDADALLDAKANGIIAHAVLDVWEPEPCIRTEVVQAANIATAHIAGHSLEGKLNGTVTAYREACHFFERPPTWDPAPLLPQLACPELQIDSRDKPDSVVLTEAVHAVYDITADDASLREATVPDATERAKNFDALRAHYGVRREFSNTRVTLSEERPRLVEKLRTLGFRIDPART